MGCPVLLAVTLKNVNGTSKDNYRSIVDTISLAVASLITCLFAFVFLVIANMLKRNNNHQSLLEFLHRCSKLLVHVCAILQTVLAYMILLTKLKFEQSIFALVVSIISIVFLLWLCIQCCIKGHLHDDNSYTGFEDNLDHSLDALTAVTSFIFLILVGLALESQEQSHRLSLPLGFTFFICVVAISSTLMGAIPWPIHFGEDDRQRKEKCGQLCIYFDYMYFTLTILLTIVLPMVTKSGKELAVGMVCFPWILIGLVYAFCICKERAGHNERGNRPSVIDEETNQCSVMDETDGQPSDSDKDMGNQPAGSTEHGSNNHLSGNEKDAGKNRSSGDPPSGSSDDGGNSKPVASDTEHDQAHKSVSQDIESARDKDGDQRLACNNDAKQKDSAGNNDLGDQKTGGNNNEAQPKTVSGVTQSANKPAPMGLTKAIFAGFLAVLIPSLSSSAVRYSTIAFIVLTAGVVISGLLWRLLTHPLCCDAPKTALAVASDVACILTYTLVMLSAVAFVVMAKDALAQDNTTCVTPCTTGQQISNLLRKCHWKMTQFDGERRSFLLSSVPC